jgi:hypothetical protein
VGLCCLCFIRGCELDNDNDLGLIAFMSGLREGKRYAEKRRPLTDDELNKIIKDTWGLVSIAPQRAVEFARSIERAHGIGEKE